MEEIQKLQESLINKGYPSAKSIVHVQGIFLPELPDDLFRLFPELNPGNHQHDALIGELWNQERGLYRLGVMLDNIRFKFIFRKDGIDADIVPSHFILCKKSIDHYSITTFRIRKY